MGGYVGTMEEHLGGWLDYLGLGLANQRFEMMQ